MPVVVYRQPWFWALLVAVLAILVFTVLIVASDRDQADSTIVQQPPAAPPPPVVPSPFPSVTPPPTVPEPAEPERPERPAEPARPQREVVRERTVIIQERPGQDRARREEAPRGETGPEAVREEGRREAPEAQRDPDRPAGLFQDTGLPREIRFEENRWRAVRTMQTAEELEPVGRAEDGTELFVPVNAAEPHRTALAPIPDEPGRYVEYRRQ